MNPEEDQRLHKAKDCNSPIPKSLEGALHDALRYSTAFCRLKLIDIGTPMETLEDLSDENIRVLRGFQRELIKAMDLLFDPKIAGELPSEALRNAALAEVERILIASLEARERPEYYNTKKQEPETLSKRAMKLIE